MKRFYIALLCLGGQVAVHAEPLQSTDQQDLTPDPRWGGSFKFGTNGLGMDITHEFTGKSKLFARLSGTYLSPSFSMPYTFSGNALQLQVNPTLGYLGLNAVFQINSEYSNIGFTLGGAYMFTRMNVVGTFKEDQFANEVLIPREEVGLMQATIATGRLAPYVGLVLGRSLPRKRIGFNVELGTFYHGSPQVDFNFTELLAPSNEQESVMQDNLKDWVWLPQMMFNLTFKIN
ncbi:MAG: hypothetical protein HC842_06230 [Cytophagales bacterium]|nr:hypothetical protein [Cytophagales bacterium]